jgi:gamma-glutamyl-gamma-aminobutyrate hydrolase PuuD
MKKILVVKDMMDLGSSYFEPFRGLGEYESDPKALNDPSSVLGVVFTGGADVSPEMYGEPRYYLTYPNAARDKYEMKVFKEAKKHNLPMVGICRGAQFLSVMSGGKLCQHIKGHGGRHHDIRTETGRLLRVNSFHHQMQMPPPDAKILAWAEPSLSDVYEIKKRPKKEYECVLYPSINAVGMQYHPEVMSEDSEGFKYCRELIKLVFKE